MMDEEQFDIEIQALHLVEDNNNQQKNDSENASLISSQKSYQTRQHWKDAAKKALHLSDPWEEFHLEDLDSEVVSRYRFNAVRQTWVKDDAVVKIAKEPFSHGAMRSCYRLKKLSTFCHRQNWSSASNYVAKRYMEDVDPNVYFEDVKLQIDAKLWGEEYNRHNPPKKVDIFQMSVIEFINRPGKPLFHLEHYIEGDYIKYNSNSGFISCEKMRLTPQAFSHFTFERSGHDLIVVDIQGVGDLYTDPQIHTASGLDYGDGNLGTRGMALFFQSHTCNIICESLGLSPFDLASTEMQQHTKVATLQMSCKTQVRGTEDICISPTNRERAHWKEFIRSRSTSGNSPASSPFSYDMSEFSDSSKDFSLENYRNSLNDFEDDEDAGISCEENHYHSPLFGSFNNDSTMSFARVKRRRRCESECSITEENDKVEFGERIARKSRPSCVNNEVQWREVDDKYGNSVLGQIHMDLAKYHELGRFCPDGQDYDTSAAFYHLKQAANCGNLEGVNVIARVYLNMPHNLLSAVTVNDEHENAVIGIDYLKQAASSGDRAAMISLAKAYDSGEHVSERNWMSAVDWYDRAVKTEEADEGGEYDGCMDDPSYELLARQAELYRKGGFMLQKDPNKAGELYQLAAEAAMSCMKGKLANKYYMSAEESFSEDTA